MTTTNNKGPKVSVIGLGNMGAVLAKTLLAANYEVTVWNRSTAKADVLKEEGALVAEDAAGAIVASPVIITCLSDYATTATILPTEGNALSDKTVIEFTTGTPQEARDAEARVWSAGGTYLDGALLATPRQIGQPETPIFVSGAENTFREQEALLKVLGGNIMYMGAAAGAAAAWDLGVLSSMFGMMMGFIHGAHIFESEGIAVDELGNMVQAIAPVLGEMIRYEGETIRKDDYSHPESTLDICANTFQLMVQQAKEAGINGAIPAFTLDLFRKAQQAGYGSEEVASVIKVLRQQ